MAKDHRLDLGRYIKSPFETKVKLDFQQLFSSKPETGDAPWTPSRFASTDLLNRLQTRKLKLNPRLGFVGAGDNENVVFKHLGRFERKEDYSFEEGRPVTKHNPREQPDFNEAWIQAYEFSPTMDPERKAKNPMPRASNLDPKGYLMQMAESSAENDVNPKASIAALLATKQEKPTREDETKAVEQTPASPAPPISLNK
jgi:hypothetical protein